MMSAFSPARGVVFVAALALAGAGLALPALADAPTTVTFQAHNPWTQEIGSVDRYNDSRDYTVAASAGKTLQINLVTRDPNVFFKVKNETTDKQLVDTFQTGATTWSTSVDTTATYTIHVYVDPNAMQRGEDAKYALQIGQYGPEDMQAATAKVTFQPNNPWAQEVGSLDSRGPVQDYTVDIAAGDTLQVNLVTRDSRLHFKVEDQTNNQQLVDTATTDTNKWSTPVATAATYKIEVYVNRDAMQRGEIARYALQVGHYPTRTTAPASAASAAQPAASAPPASSALP
ncbi:MAG: hypothetical protein ACREPY_12275 [Rhodanobacteraceae bacterium]